jgi:hypothetical protein
MQHGMSIGIGDTVADAATGASINKVIDDAKDEVKRIIEMFQVRITSSHVHFWGLAETPARLLCWPQAQSAGG